MAEELIKDKWWLAETLTREKRAEMTELQRLQRREMHVNQRIARAEQKLDSIRRRKFIRLLNEWFRGEVMREFTAREEQTSFTGLKAWLRQQFVHAVQGAFNGSSHLTVVESTIRAEVGKVLSASQWTKDAAGRDRFQEYVKTVVRDEVRKAIMDSISIDAVVRGHVHTPAKGERSLKLESDE